MQYTYLIVSIPDRPDVLRVTIVKTRLTLLNRAAAYDARVIWLLWPGHRFPNRIMR